MNRRVFEEFQLSTSLTVTIRSDVTIAPFRWFTASPLSRACALAQGGKTHSRAPYHFSGKPSLVYVVAASTPYKNRLYEICYQVKEAKKSLRCLIEFQMSKFQYMVCEIVYSQYRSCILINAIFSIFRCQ